MIKRIFTFFLVLFAVNTLVLSELQAGTKGFLWDWNRDYKQYRTQKKYNPHLENARHLQIPQWADEDWYVEDWTSQQDGMTIIEGFYAADILRDQKIGYAELPDLVVGPNFYHLSGFDKRRVVHTVDAVYGVTDKHKNASFILTDWNTKMPIGMFDKNGLRLH